MQEDTALLGWMETGRGKGTCLLLQGWQHSGWAPSHLKLLSQKASGCALRGRWAAARMGLCLRSIADPKALVLGEEQHQGPITGAGPTGRALYHMPGVARGHGTLKAARPEAWQWGGHMEGRVGEKG